MAVEDIKKMYESMYNSQVTELERQRQKALEDATNRENQTNLQYKELTDGYNRNKDEAKGKFYDERNQVSTQNSKQVQQTRDWMAKNNLLQSGESVDAMLRNNTDLNNGLGNIATNETNTIRGIDDKIGASEREKTQKLNELLAYRNSANEDYNAQKNSYYQQMQSNSIKDINAYNEQLRQEQVAAQRAAEERAFALQQAAAARSASASAAAAKSSSYTPSLAEEKKNLKADFMTLVQGKNNGEARKFLEEGKDSLTSQYGSAFYKDLFDSYWKDMGNYYKPSKNATEY